MSDSNRTRGVVGQFIPAEVLEPVARRIVAAMFGVDVDEVQHVKVSMPVLLLSREAPEGGSTEFAAVNTEGVGSKSDDFSIRAIEIWVESGMTYVPVLVGIPYLLQLATETAQVKDLADHVRSFGDRLERNFSIWNTWDRSGRDGDLAPKSAREHVAS